MSVCEKCWSDAGGNLERYLEILKEREDNPCTEREQKGVYYVEVKDRAPAPDKQEQDDE